MLACMSLNIPFALFQLNVVGQFCLTLLSSLHLVTLQFLSFILKKSLKRLGAFQEKNQEPVFLSLEDIKNSVNQGLTCKSSYSVLAVQAEFTITSLWRSRSFLHLEMKVFPSCEQRAGIPENVIIFHQRGKEPNVFALSLNRLISVIAFVFIINFSL